jgi:hypothetical protein
MDPCLGLSVDGKQLARCRECTVGNLEWRSTTPQDFRDVSPMSEAQFQVALLSRLRLVATIKTRPPRLACFRPARPVVRPAAAASAECLAERPRAAARGQRSVENRNLKFSNAADDADKSKIARVQEFRASPAQNI